MGEEIELWSGRSDDGTLVLVKDGGEPPGPEWHTQVLPNRFARTPFSHRREVPATEVTDTHSVRVTGTLRFGGRVEILAEDSEGKLAVVAGADFPAEEKWDLVENFGFDTFHNEPVQISGVFGWLPAELVHNIKSEVRWWKDAT